MRNHLVCSPFKDKNKCWEKKMQSWNKSHLINLQINEVWLLEITSTLDWNWLIRVFLYIFNHRKFKLSCIGPCMTLFDNDISLMIDLSPFKPAKLDKSEILPGWWSSDVAMESTISFAVRGHFWLFWVQEHSCCLHRHFLFSDGPSFLDVHS